jgi:replication factor C large subunit
MEPVESVEKYRPLWVEKYRPQTLKDVVADKTIIEKVTAWAKKWQSGGIQKPLLFGGPPGIGKTSLALALANTFGWEAVELNASDQRNWQIINRIVGEGAFNQTISDEGEFLSTEAGKLKLIILDEVDNIHKKEDAGGEGALIRLLKKRPRQPIILIANDPYALSPELRNLCDMVNFKRLDIRRIVKVLEKICSAEGVKADKKVLEAIVRNAGGDLRAAINDLQAIAEGREEIKIDDVVIAKRTQESDVFKVMQKIFKTYSTAVHNEAMLLDESPDDLIMWVDENLPREYIGEDLLMGYKVLSRADIFLGRVRRRQFYRMWKYASYLMTVGVQQSKREIRKGFTRYQRPSTWQMLFRTRSMRERLKSILTKISRYSHLSTKKAYSEMYFLLRKLISEAEIPVAASISAFYDFSEEDLVFMTGDEKRAKEIAEYIAKYGLHRVEDESFLSTFDRKVEAVEGVEEELERFEKKEDDEEMEEAVELKQEDSKTRKRAKKGKTKDATLDTFFS